MPSTKRAGAALGETRAARRFGPALVGPKIPPANATIPGDLPPAPIPVPDSPTPLLPGAFPDLHLRGKEPTPGTPIVPEREPRATPPQLAAKVNTTRATACRRAILFISTIVECSDDGDDEARTLVKKPVLEFTAAAVRQPVPRDQISTSRAKRDKEKKTSSMGWLSRGALVLLCLVLRAEGFTAPAVAGFVGTPLAHKSLRGSGASRPASAGVARSLGQRPSLRMPTMTVSDSVISTEEAAVPGGFRYFGNEADGKKIFRVVLMAGFETFNRELYKRAAERAVGNCDGLEIFVFTDADIDQNPEALASALEGADVFFGSLIFDFNQVWLPSLTSSDSPVILHLSRVVCQP